jgi:hypothetical protein
MRPGLYTSTAAIFSRSAVPDLGRLEFGFGSFGGRFRLFSLRARDSLKGGSTPTLKYKPGTIVAEGDFVIVHGRFSGFGAPVNWIAADSVRIQNGILVEH